MDKNWKNKNFFIALKNAFNGIKCVLKNERNLKIQVFFAIVAIFISVFLKISLIEWAIIVLIIFMVFLTEIFNTAIENVTDMITLEYNEKAKIVKDISAGAVVLTSVASIIIGGLIFLPKILEFIKI